ncbi:MAG: galactokinase [Proteobacteria bacterium]|nr:galactokinase [Pseudomonadota bacterium]
MEPRIQKLQQEFKKQFGFDNDTRLFRAPGRVNLIGEHTDYNEGFVLPAAIDRSILALARPRKDAQVRIYSLDFKNLFEFSLDKIKAVKDSWGNYPMGVAQVLEGEKFKLKGFEAVFESNVPVGAGLSSSAAIELVNAFIFDAFSELKLDRVKMALLCQKAENEFVGVNCGIMDQFIIALGEKDRALFLDCRDLSYRLVPVPSEKVKLVITNTKVKRSLAGSEYNQRREECNEGVKLLKKNLPKIKSLRDVTPEDLVEHQNILPEIVRKRCTHVVMENDRVTRAVEALTHNNLREFGRLMVESHNSLRDLYQVSCPELDLLVKNALSLKGVLGSRMTGAGFGGCTVSLVDEKFVDEFRIKSARGYQKGTGKVPEFYVCKISDGVKEITTS